MSADGLVLSELLSKIGAKYPELSDEVVKTMVRLIFDEIISALEDGGRVELRGFGTFSLTKREGGARRNPKTGAEIAVDDKRYVQWRTGKSLHNKLQVTR